MSGRVIYYRDELHDDFAGTSITAQTVDGSFRYTRGGLFEARSSLLYRLVALPLAYLISKLYLGVRFKNRKALKGLKGGYFIYGNHTRVLDVFMPPLAAFPRRAYTVSSPDAVSIKGLRRLVMLLGCLPLPTGVSGMEGFCGAVQKRIAQGACVAVFPEAHVWPFYTGIRPFPATSFRYPAKLGVPCVSVTATYRKRRGLFRLCRRPATTFWVGEPQFPDMSLPLKERAQRLRDAVYAEMCEVSSTRENVEYIKYVKIPPEGTADAAR